MQVKNILKIQVRVFEGHKKEKKNDEYYTKDSSSENPFVLKKCFNLNNIIV